MGRRRQRLLLALAPSCHALGTLLVRTEPRLDYVAAGHACALANGELVTIGSEADNAAVMAAKAAANLAGFGVWVGGFSGDYRKTWFWPSFSYDGTQHCLFMMADGSWEDWECGREFAYVCEFPLPPPTPPPPFPPGKAPLPPPPSPPQQPPPPPSPPPGPPDSTAAIVAGSMCGGLLLLCWLYWLLKRRRRAALSAVAVQ